MTASIQNRPVPLPTLSPLEQAAIAKQPLQINVQLKQVFGPEASFQAPPAIMEKFQSQYYELEAHIIASLTPSPLSPPLHRAAFSGDVKTVASASPERLRQIDLAGLTPLHYAILGKQKAAVEALLSQVDLTYRPANGNTYLHFAAMTGDAELLELFLGKIDASFVNAKGQTAAHFWATSSNDMKTLKKLFEAGAPMNGSHPLLLSPLATVIFRAIEKNPALISKADLKLLAVNIARLLALKGTYEISNSRDFTNSDLTGQEFVHFLAMDALRPVLGFYKRSVIQEFTPVQKKGLADLLASPVFGLGATIVDPKRDSGRWLSGLSSLAAASIVGTRAVNRVYDSRNASLSTKIAAISLHFFNTGCALFDALVALNPSTLPDHDSEFLRAYGDASENQFIIATKIHEYFQGQGNSKPPEPKPDDTAEPFNPEKYKTMTLVDRLLDPELTDGLTSTIPIYPNNYGVIFDPVNPPAGQASAKAAYRKASLAFHPDRPLSEEIVTTLQNKCVTPLCETTDAACINAFVKKSVSERPAESRVQIDKLTAAFKEKCTIPACTTDKQDCVDACVKELQQLAFANLGSAFKALQAEK